MDHPLIGATGRALALIAALLQRAGVATPEQFADLLGALAGASSAEEPVQHQALTSWSEIVRRVGAPERGMLLAGGDALAALSLLLDRGGIIERRELGALLGLYACTVAETNPSQADILACWAAMVRAAAGPLRSPSGAGRSE